MGWWTDLFKVKDVVTDSGLPNVSVKIPMPKVKPPKPEKDVSEPVLSFVECVRKDPKRFRIKQFSILDKKTGEFFKVKYGNYLVDDDYNVSWLYEPVENTSWTTNDERDWAVEELIKIQQDKVKAYKDKQRKKYMNIYKESK